MNIKILHLVEGARKARGLTVIIDVFRAHTVETYLMLAGAARVIPVGDLQIAYDYKKNHPDAILCGERKGRIVDGFDYGNSPAQLENADLAGKTVIHTTSAGTQGIANAIHAEEIIGGNLVAAKAIATYIKRRNPKEVSLVCMGLAGNRETQEDTLCANYIKSLLEDAPMPNITQEIEKLKTTSGAKFFEKDRQDVFPERDFYLCTRLNTIPFILRLSKETKDGLRCMERVDVEDCWKAVFDKEKREPTAVSLGDTMSKFTREQVLAFPDEVKGKIVYGNYTEPEGRFDAALVLGGAEDVMESRAKAAAGLYHSGRCSLFITTGGVYRKSPYGYLSEAQTLARYMEDLGVPGPNIQIEERATTTHENMTYSRQLLKEHFHTLDLRLLVVSSAFHITRGTSLAKAYIPEATVEGIRGVSPMDNALEYSQSPLMCQRLEKECACLWNYVKRGLIPDFAVW